MIGIPSPSLIQQLKCFDSPTISNSVEALNIRDRTEGYASMDVRCLFPELKPMVGHAVTCKADSTSLGLRRSNGLSELFDAIVAMPKPVVIVIQNCGPDRLRSCFVGDMVALAYQKLGAVGVATDGGIRDLSGIRRRAPGFQVFAAGAVVSHGNAAFVEVGKPVKIGGLPIEAGDLLHGDESGLVNVPIQWVETILKEAALVQKTEEEWIDFASSKSCSLEGLKQRLAR